MPPLRMHPQRDVPPPSAAPRSPVTPSTPAPARQFKILQSSRAPAQLTLALHRSA